MSASLKQTNYHFSFTIGVQNSKQNVWQLLIDIPTWKKWDTELKEASLTGDFAIGTKGFLTPIKGPKLTFYISELIPEQSYTFKTKMPLGWLVIKRTLKTENEITYFTDDISFTGVLKIFFGLFLGRKFRKILPEVMNNFKKIVENNHE